MNQTTLSPHLLNVSQPTSFSIRNNEGQVVKGFEVLAYVIIFVIAIIGNCFLIMAYRRNISGQMRSVYNLLVASIAASDLLLAVWSIPERITRVLTNDAWHIYGVFGE